MSVEPEINGDVGERQWCWLVSRVGEDRASLSGRLESLYSLVRSFRDWLPDGLLARFAANLRVVYSAKG